MRPDVKKRNYSFLIKLLCSSCLIGWFLWRYDVARIIKILLSISPSAISIILIIYIIGLYIAAAKWHLLLNDSDIKQLFLLSLIAQYYSLILPGQIAGEVVKMYKLGHGHQCAERVAVSVVIDRVTGLISLILVGLAGLIWSKEGISEHITPWFVLFFIILAGVLFSLHFSSFEVAVRKLFLLIQNSFHRAEKIVNTGFRFIDAWRQYLRNPLILLKSLFYGIAFQLINVCIYLMFANAIGISLPFSDWCWIFGVISMVVFLPITIGGIGLREGGFVFILGNLGILSEKALALSLSLFGLRVLGAFIGGITEFKAHFNTKSSQSGK